MMRISDLHCSVCPTVIGGEEEVSRKADLHTVRKARYILADITTHFHCGEAVLKSNGADGPWRCMFTLSNRYIDTVSCVPIERSSIIRVIRELEIQNLNEFMTSNYAEQP